MIGKKGAEEVSSQYRWDHEARRLLGSLAERTVFEVVVEGGDTSLSGWVVSRAFDVILLPARRRLFSRGAHPVAATLRGSTAADVRIVGA